MKLGMHGPIFLNIVCANTGSFVRAPRGGKAALENARVALSSCYNAGATPRVGGRRKNNNTNAKTRTLQIVTVITGTTHCNSRNRTFIQKRRTSTVVFGPLKPTNRFEFRNTRTERRPSPGRGRRRLRCDKVCSSVIIRSWSRRVVLVADLIRSSPLRSARCELTGSDSIGSDASPDGNPACVCADLSHHEFKSFDLGHKPFRPLFYAISVPPPPHHHHLLPSAFVSHVPSAFVPSFMPSLGALSARQ